MSSMLFRSLLSTVILGLLAATTAANAQDTASPSTFKYNAAELPLVLTTDLLGGVTGAPSKRFLLQQGVPTHMVAGLMNTKSVSYAVLLTILRNNGVAAVLTDDVITLIPDARIRQYALPTVTSLDAKRPDDEWVNYILQPQHLSAVQLVPILRPLLPQEAHMAALPAQNSVIFVDRFGNLKRIMSLVRALDKPAVAREDGSQQ